MIEEVPLKKVISEEPDEFDSVREELASNYENEPDAASDPEVDNE